MVHGYSIRIAADSTMLRIVNLFIALSFGVHLEQLEQRIGLTWPRPFLLRPLEGHCQLSPPKFNRDIGCKGGVLRCALLDHFCDLCFVSIIRRTGEALVTATENFGLPIELMCERQINGSFLSLELPHS